MNKKIREEAKITLMRNTTTGANYGIVELQHLANPETVCVYLDYTKDLSIIPESFDIYGHPIINKELVEYAILSFMEYSYGQFCKEIPVTVFYEPQEFSVPKSDFDSIEGIKNSISNLKDFTEMLKNRKRYLKFHKANKISISECSTEEFLNEYVIWNRFILDRFANVYRIKENITFGSDSDIMTLKYFDFLMEDLGYYTETTAEIPEYASVCPICGQKITMDDLKTTELSRVNGKICHHDCKITYEKYTNTWNIF